MTIDVLVTNLIRDLVVVFVLLKARFGRRAEGGEGSWVVVWSG
jgi:hypothetical protein